jgi:hypothetical protein
MRKSVIPRKQVNVRLREHNINLMNRAAVLLDMTQGEVVEKALEMFAARKKIVLEEGGE